MSKLIDSGNLLQNETGVFQLADAKEQTPRFQKQFLEETGIHQLADGDVEAPRFQKQVFWGKSESISDLGL